MSDSAELPPSCPQCGATLPSEATEGLCPQCLLAQVMQLPDAEPRVDNPGSTIPLASTRPRPTLAGSSSVELPLPEELDALLPAGSYRIEDFIGRGGMGGVYKGVQVRLKRQVAIKVMRRDQGKDHDFETRFEREAQAMAKLNHPNIVNVIDYGEAGADYLYIVMEFVDGADLMDVIRTGRMTQEMALALLPQICDALQFAHDHGIIHRDIKPSNIMLTRDGHIKMADFGLAKLYGAESNFHTQTGTGMGTPDYAAPEQFDPTAQIDHRADIYALGVMIYQMITGSLPRGVWKPPSHRAEVSTGWDDIVSHAMQSDPKDRYQSATEVKTDVSGISLVKESAPPVLAPRKSRVPLLIGIAAAALIAGAFFAFKKPNDAVVGQTVHLLTGDAKANTASGAPASPSPTEDATKDSSSRREEAQTTLPTTSPIPTTKDASSAPWQPLFTDAEWTENKPGNRETVGGRLHFIQGFQATKPMPAADGAIRARVQWRKESKYLAVKARKTEVGEYKLQLNKDRVSLDYFPLHKRGTNLNIYLLPKPLQPGDTASIELRLQGDHLTGLFNGAVVVEAQDSRLTAPGEWGILGQDGWFESVEVQTPPPAAEWQDLLALLTPELVAQTGHGWRLENHALLSPNSQFAAVPFPGNCAGASYQARVKVRKLSASRSDFHVILPVGDRMTGFDLEGYAGQYTGLNKADGKSGASLPGVVTGRQINDTQPHDLEISVRLDGANARITTTLDSRPLYEWAGPISVLSRYGSWATSPRDCLALGSLSSGWEISEVKVKRLDTAAVTKAAPVARPFGPWQPLFTDAEWKDTKPGKREVVDGRLHFKMFQETKPAPAADGAIRARIQYQSGSKDMGFFARSSENAGLYKAQLDQYGVALMRFPAKSANSDATLGKYDLPKPLKPGDTMLFELRLQGDHLTVLLDGAAVIEAQDSHLLAPGKWGIIANDGWFESVEVQTPPASAKASGALALQAATKDAPFVNTLGMKFVPVPGTKALFSIWDTRVQDYAAYAKAKQVDNSWTKMEKGGVPVGREPDHPVVGVNWDEAQGFCQWLTQKEIAEGKLPKSAAYRLPSDEEWSWAVGLPPELGTTPAEKNGKNSVDFPWGKEWPPTQKVGNYADEAFHAKFPLRKNEQGNTMGSGWIEGYNDGYVTTSPVGSFAANAYGLYDMGGNVWQWCEDWFDNDHKDRVLRGAAWDAYSRYALLSSQSFHLAPTSRHSGSGFRCVLEPAPAAVSAASVTAAPVSASGALALPSATKDAPLVNSLGMKFVPVPITGGPTDKQTMLFSIWETRVQDYEVFATRTKREWKKVTYEQGPTDPAAGVSWEDAQAFCVWLTAHERLAGTLPVGAFFRLPSDHEWSCAVGIGDKEDPAKTPAEKSTLLKNIYPWGGTWPAPDDAGNYSSAEAEGLPKEWVGHPLTTRHDGYGTTAPVGSYRPNSLGLYDLGGNVWEWCEDWMDGQENKRVLRGASFTDESLVYSSSRTAYPPNAKLHHGGFRVVLATSVSVSPRLPVSASSASAFGPWQPLFTEAEWKRPAPGREVVDGRLHLLPKNEGTTKPQPAADGAIRARIQYQTGPQSAGFFARASEDGRYKAELNLGRSVLLQYFPPNEGRVFTTLGKYVLPKPLQPGDTLQLELRLQGEHLTVLVDGVVAIEATDSRSPGPGRWGIIADDGWFESVEVQSPLPAAAPTANPFGPWQPLITDAQLKHPKQPGLYEVVDGGIHLMSSALLKPQPAADGAIRARMKRDITLGTGAGFTVRSTEVGRYKLKVVNGRTLELRYVDGKSVWDEPGNPSLGRVDLAKLLKLGDTLLLELRLQGDHLIALADGVVAIDTHDSRLSAPGEWGIIGKDAWFESLEVQSPPPTTSSSRREEAQTTVPAASPAAPTSKPDQLSVTSVPPATKDTPFINTLGMKFVPVPGTDVLFCIHETRTKDFGAYIKDGGTVTGRDNGWALGQAKNLPDYPMGGMTWDDAHAFCLWLSTKEGKTYRLPTDREWSYAVGIGDQEKWDANTTPATLNKKVPGQYPWGTQWPPPKGAGNYRDETYNAKDPKANGKYIEGYNDGFDGPAPVMSFTPNRLGIYDLGGNVPQWVEDWFDAKQELHTLRGSGASQGDRAADLLSSTRAGMKNAPGAPGMSGHGFRVVLVPSAPDATKDAPKDTSSSRREEAQTSAPTASPVAPAPKPIQSPVTSAATATKDAPFVNTLGMKFVPVPIVAGIGKPQGPEHVEGTVLFSIWDTRVQDYEVFATETKREWPKADFEQGPTHPAVNVSWDDATAFCAWLTEREHKAGKLGANDVVRLPSDHEWSCAVGIGEQEDAALLPDDKDRKVRFVFPWGTAWPPPAGTGNFGGEELQPLVASGQYDFLNGKPTLKGYRDDFVFTSPVASYAANPFGLYDMSGNVVQWCEDWGGGRHLERSLRGASWVTADEDYLFSSRRFDLPPDKRNTRYGFRCVLGPAPSSTATKDP